MSNVFTKVPVNKCDRTYSARLSSRDGMVIKSIVARQRVGQDYDGSRSAWSSATLLFTDIVDGLHATETKTVALENKIAYQCPVKKSGNLYACRVGSRNGAVISGITVKQIVAEDNV